MAVKAPRGKEDTLIALVLQIYFGVRAFRNGWRWRVAYPFGVWHVTAVLLGLASGSLVMSSTVADAGLW